MEAFASEPASPARILRYYAGGSDGLVGMPANLLGTKSRVRVPAKWVCFSLCSWKIESGSPLLVNTPIRCMKIGVVLDRFARRWSRFVVKGLLRSVRPYLLLATVALPPPLLCDLKVARQYSYIASNLAGSIPHLFSRSETSRGGRGPTR